MQLGEEQEEEHMLVVVEDKLVEVDKLVEDMLSEVDKLVEDKLVAEEDMLEEDKKVVEDMLVDYIDDLDMVDADILVEQHMDLGYYKLKENILEEEHLDIRLLLFHHIED